MRGSQLSNKNGSTHTCVEPCCDFSLKLQELRLKFDIAHFRIVALDGERAFAPEYILDDECVIFHVDDVEIAPFELQCTATFAKNPYPPQKVSEDIPHVCLQNSTVGNIRLW